MGGAFEVGCELNEDGRVSLWHGGELLRELGGAALTLLTVGLDAKVGVLVKEGEDSPHFGEVGFGIDLGDFVVRKG